MSRSDLRCDTVTGEMSMLSLAAIVTTNVGVWPLNVVYIIDWRKVGGGQLSNLSHSLVLFNLQLGSNGQCVVLF